MANRTMGVSRAFRIIVNALLDIIKNDGGTIDAAVRVEAVRLLDSILRSGDYVRHIVE